MHRGGHELERNTMRHFIFVGERPSPTAARRGWTWRDGRLCARTLHQALAKAGIDPSVQRYCNLWHEPGTGRPSAPPRFSEVREAQALGYTVVALGALVAGALRAEGIASIKLRHPAARGAGRAREVYEDHVRAALRPGTRAEVH